MKKVLAWLLSLMMILGMAGAVAETQTPVVAIEDLFEGVWVQFEDGFELYLPADWYEIEVSEEWNAKGIFYAAGTEDFSHSCSLAWQPMEAEYTLEQLQAELVSIYPDASVVEVNGVGIIPFVDAENNLLNVVALDAAEPGYYLFSFYPANDEDFQVLASLIASTIRNIE